VLFREKNSPVTVGRYRADFWLKTVKNPYFIGFRPGGQSVKYRQVRKLPFVSAPV
jgi:hypothetical protein